MTKINDMVLLDSPSRLRYSDGAYRILRDTRGTGGKIRFTKPYGATGSGYALAIVGQALVR